MSPSWYDLLGVDTDATTEEIRAAWKAGIADLDPADRRFRLLNQAAEVLLDPTERAAYDASLAPAVVEEVAQQPSRDLASDAETDSDPVPENTSPDLETGASAPSSTTGAAGRGVSGWLLAGVAVLTAIAVGLAAFLATKPSDQAVADGTSSAQAAAESAAETILSYDYRTMDEDQEKAGALMTGDYRKEYDKLFAVLKENAAETKVQVTTELVASGITRAGADRVQVLVFVDRPTVNVQSPEPKVYRDQVTMTMENVDGEWLVDGLKTTPVEA